MATWPFLPPTRIWLQYKHYMCVILLNILGWWKSNWSRYVNNSCHLLLSYIHHYKLISWDYLRFRLSWMWTVPWRVFIPSSFLFWRNWINDEVLVTKLMIPFTRVSSKFNLYKLSLLCSRDLVGELIWDMILRLENWHF